MSGITHIEGDCLEVMPTLPRKSFDLLLTDPPYAMPATYYQGWKNAKKWSDTSIMQAWWRVVSDEIWPLLKENAMVAVFCNAQAAATFYPIWYERTNNLQMAVWDKIFFGMGSPLRNTCEYILVGSVGKTFSSRNDQSNIFRHKIINHTKRIHPVQKPTALIEDLVTLFCPEGGNALDPFAGSGVVASVCERTGRSCTSIEWDASEHHMPQPMLLSTNGVHE